MPWEQSQEISNKVQIISKKLICFSLQQFYQKQESLFNIFFIEIYLKALWDGDEIALLVEIGGASQ